MAILINKNVSISGGIPLNELYVRINYKVNIFGDVIEGKLLPYVSKGAFTSNWQENALKVDDLNLTYDFPYDSSLNGDPLLYVHDKIKEELSTDKTKVEQVLDPSTGSPVYIQEPVLDPSTGEQMTDPSTGDLLWMNGDPSTMIVVVTPKFAMDSSISFIDLD